MSEQTRMAAATIVVGAMLGAVIFFTYAQAAPQHGLVVKKTAATVAQQLQPTQHTDHFQHTTNPQ